MVAGLLHVRTERGKEWLWSVRGLLKKMIIVIIVSDACCLPSLYRLRLLHVPILYRLRLHVPCLLSPFPRPPWGRCGGRVGGFPRRPELNAFCTL